MKSSLKIDFFEDGTPFILIKDYAGNDMGDARDKLIRNFVVDAKETGLTIRAMKHMDEFDGGGEHLAIYPIGKANGSPRDNWASVRWEKLKNDGFIVTKPTPAGTSE